MVVVSEEGAALPEDWPYRLGHTAAEDCRTCRYKMIGYGVESPAEGTENLRNFAPTNAGSWTGVDYPHDHPE